MTRNEQKRLISINAGIWAAATILSFILPFVSDSFTAGRSAFLRAFLHAAVLIGGMLFTSFAISKAIGPPSDQ